MKIISILLLLIIQFAKAQNVQPYKDCAIKYINIYSLYDLETSRFIQTANFVKSESLKKPNFFLTKIIDKSLFNKIYEMQIDSTVEEKMCVKVCIVIDIYFEKGGVEQLCFTNKHMQSICYNDMEYGISPSLLKAVKKKLPFRIRRQIKLKDKSPTVD